MPPAESALAQAERHVREGEERVAHQKTILTELIRDKQDVAAEKARTVLMTLETTLELAREHLRLEQEAPR